MVLATMRNLKRTLQDQDPALLPVLAKRWGVTIQNLSHDEIIDALSAAMLERDRAETVWESLDEDQRGALQALLGSGGRMPATMFTRLFGEIRQGGAAWIEREKPHQNPASSAEALYYRGLIAQAFEQVEAGPRQVIYVPDDLIAVLPSHKTTYADLEEPAAPGAVGERYDIEPLDEVENVQQADTSLVDDMTTLLAYLRLHSPLLHDDTLAGEDQARLLPHLFQAGLARLGFLVGVGISAGLIDVEAGRATPKRAEAQRWLEQARAVQVRQLAEAWRESTIYRDLWHVPGLHPEPTGWPYDPVVPRKALVSFLGDIVPEQDWWSLDEFIEEIRLTEPDFQRPGGDYHSWYIRNDEGDYLNGFESWDAVEGALLEYYLQGPMHWLGLVDLADDAARLTAYGRAFANIIAWPSPPEQDDRIIVEDDGTLLVSRRVSRIDRFQVARFTSWTPASDPYAYRLDAQGVAQAARQGITTGHISAFISRILGEKPVPPRIRQLLDTWQAGPTASVTLERVLVLRTTAPETLNFVLETPALRRYLGAQLGPMAVIVRADQAEALRAALGEHGIQAEFTG
jgi:hypothetical protein